MQDQNWPAGMTLFDSEWSSIVNASDLEGQAGHDSLSRELAHHQSFSLCRGSSTDGTLSAMVLLVPTT